MKFNDTSGSLELSAVLVMEGSSYFAEDTSFVGFTGEVRGVHIPFFFCRTVVNATKACSGIAAVQVSCFMESIVRTFPSVISIVHGN